MEKGQMSHENASFGNIAPGQRFYEGQLVSRGGNKTKGRESLRGVSGRNDGFPGMIGGVPRMPDGVQRMPDEVQRMPGGVQRMPGGVQRMPGGVHMMPGGVHMMPGGVQRMPGGVQRMSGGVQRMPGGVHRMPGGVHRMPSGVPGMEGGVLGMPGAFPGRPGGVLGKSSGVEGTPGLVPGRMVSTSQPGLDGSCGVNTRGENVSRRGPGDLGQYIFSGDNGIMKDATASRSKLVTCSASRSPGVKSMLPSRGGSCGVNGGSSFTSRGSFMIRGQGLAGMNKRGGIRMTRTGAAPKSGFGMVTRGGAVAKRGFGMVTRGGARMSAAGAVPRGGARLSVAGAVPSRGRVVVSGGIGTSGGAGIGQVGTINMARNGIGMNTGDVQLTQDLAGMVSKGGMGRSILKFSGGKGMSNSGGGFKRAIEMTRDGGHTGGVEINKDSKGFTGNKMMTRGVGGFTGDKRMVRGVGGFTENRVTTTGVGGCNGIREKQGNTTENVIPDVTTSNRIIEAIDLDQTFNTIEEHPTINDQNVDQEPLSEEDIRDRYYGGLNNFEEKCYDVNGNKIGDKLTAVKNDDDGSLKLLLKATVNPNITVSIVTEKISPSKNKNQEFERSVTHDKVKTHKIKESGKLNTNDVKKEDDVKINMEQVDVMDLSVATSIRKKC